MTRKQKKTVIFKKSLSLLGSYSESTKGIVVAGAAGGLAGGIASGFFGAPSSASWKAAFSAAKKAGVAGMLGGAFEGLTQQLLEAGQNCECDQ